MCIRDRVVNEKKQKQKGHKLSKSLGIHSFPSLGPESNDADFLSTLLLTGSHLDFGEFRVKFLEALTRHEECRPECHHFKRFLAWLETHTESHIPGKLPLSVKKVVIDRVAAP
eukprot:TRINITY_DN7200_c0_g1_i2.p1 TRINITY_DN7200_c0_g1~~TRINITY_DN7200_c0_g1_i2.p1  ORF type:complete len:113 (+),score=9.80 TRINITY_DN7200_c0_g1_i2:64-402(+)